MDKSRDKYDVSGNVEAQYVDSAETVLANLRGITQLDRLQVAEEEGLARAYETLLGEVRTDTPMTSALLKHIHGRIFGDLYAWAGRWRTVQISKPGVIWPAAQYLDASMQAFERDVLSRYPAPALTEEATFCEAVGEIQGEFLAVHPFREGNARTIKLMTDLLSTQTGRPLLVYDSSDAGADRYIDAARAALVRDYRPMVEVITEALSAAQKRQSP